MSQVIRIDAEPDGMETRFLNANEGWLRSPACVYRTRISLVLGVLGSLREPAEDSTIESLRDWKPPGSLRKTDFGGANVSRGFGPSSDENRPDTCMEQSLKNTRIFRGFSTFHTFSPCSRNGIARCTARFLAVRTRMDPDCSVPQRCARQWCAIRTPGRPPLKFHLKCGILT